MAWGTAAPVSHRDHPSLSLSLSSRARTALVRWSARRSYVRSVMRGAAIQGFRMALRQRDASTPSMVRSASGRMRVLLVGSAPAITSVRFQRLWSGSQAIGTRCTPCRCWFQHLQDAVVTGGGGLQLLDRDQAQGRRRLSSSHAASAAKRRSSHWVILLRSLPCVVWCMPCGGCVCVQRVLPVAGRPPGPGARRTGRRVGVGPGVRLGAAGAGRAFPEPHAVVGLVLLGDLQRGGLGPGAALGAALSAALGAAFGAGECNPPHLSGSRCSTGRVTVCTTSLYPCRGVQRQPSAPLMRCTQPAQGRSEFQPIRWN